MNERVFRHIGIPRERADPDTFAARQFLHLRQRQTRDVDQLRRRLHAHLHQVDQIGAAAEKLRLRFRGDATDRLGGVPRLYVGKRVHASEAELFLATDEHG